MPDVFDEVATQSAPKDVFDEVAGGKKDIFDEVAPSFSPQEVTDAAQNSATVAQQALDVATLPAKLDWTAANEQLDAQRLYEARSAEAAAKLAEDQGSGTGPGSEAFRLRREAQFQREQMAGGTQAARQVRGEDINALRSIEEAGTTADRPSTPASALSSILGPGLSANVQPVVEAAGHNVGGATGGALGAALGAAATAGTGGVFPLLYGLAGAFLGSQAGGAAQEGVLSTTETPEETAARHQRTAEDIAANPGAAHVGAALATAPFFGPSLAQFGRAAAGDTGAILNLGLAGGIGAGMEAIGAKMRGESAKPEDIAAAIFTNLVMNKPTRLGQAIGLHPSSEEALTKEAETKYRELPPLPFEVKGETQGDVTTRAPSSTADVFANAQKRSPIEIAGVEFKEVPSQDPNRLTLVAEDPSGVKARFDYIRDSDGVLRPTPGSGIEILDPKLRNKGLGGEVTKWVAENKGPVGSSGLSEAVTSSDALRMWKRLESEGAKIESRSAQAVQDDLGEAQAYVLRQKQPTTTNENAQQISETSAPDGGVRAPEVKSADALLPANESGQGVQPSGQGGSVAENAPEAPREVGDATSIKNAVTAEERAAREIPPVEEPARREFGQVWDAVKAEVADNPAAPDVLISELKGLKRPRALTDREDALLLHRQVDLQRSYDDAAAEVNRAAEAGDEPARAEAATKLDATRDALQELYDIGKRGGTETARGLAARKMMANQDFTLAAMETRLRAEQGGERLSAEQQAKVKEQADTIARTQAEMEKIIAERDALKAAAEAAKKEDVAVDPKVRSLAERIIARLDVTAANAAKSLRSRLGQLGSAPDPLIVLDVAKIAAAKTAKKAIQFAQWSAEMIQEFGEKVRPFLQAGWDQRDQHIDAEINGAVRRKAAPRTDAEKEASAVKARLTALANRTAKLQERTAKGDFSPFRKPTADLSKNPEWVKLKAENEVAKANFEKARYEARKAQRTTQQKVKDTVAGVLSASRSMLASADISAPGRQGVFFVLPDILMNPVRLGRQMATMLRSQFNEGKFQENEARIKSRDNADLYEESGLYLADIDHKPSAREEHFKSELAEKIPFFGKKIVRGSNRGFISFLNTMRADAMDAFVRWSGGKENLNAETKKYLAAAINDLTGRGNITNRQALGAMEWLAKYLFSPRLWVSRFHTAILKPIWRDPFNTAISPRGRAVVASQYVKFLGAIGALKFLAGLNGGKMEQDPRDSDFGKLQFGSKRYDISGGIGNMITLLARIATQKTKDDRGKLLRIAWFGDQRPEREMGQIIFNHLRNKAAPIPGAIYDYIYGRHPDRSKVTVGSMVKQTAIPITPVDTLGYFQKDTPASALKDTLINALGFSVRDYSQ